MDGSPEPTQPAGATPNSSSVENVEIAPFADTVEIRAFTAEVLERQRLNDLCSTTDCLPELTTTMQAITAQIAVDPEGNDVPPEEVADRVIDFFEEVRSIATEIPADGGGGSVLMEPVGATVIADLELEGLRGRELRLFWSMLRVNGGDTPLFSRWLGDTPVYRLLPKSDRVTTSVRFWVPLPQGPGTYIVSLTLTSDGTPLARSVSNHVE